MLPKKLHGAFHSNRSGEITSGENIWLITQGSSVLLLCVWAFYFSATLSWKVLHKFYPE